MKAFIKAISYNLPEKILDNEQIAKEFPEWTVEKINNKIGIKQRHVTAEGETASDLAIGAADKLFPECLQLHAPRRLLLYLLRRRQCFCFHLRFAAGGA